MTTKPPFYFHVADNGYIYDKRIWWGIIILAILVCGFVFLKQGSEYTFYIKCENMVGCQNPLYESEFYNPRTGYNYLKDCTEEWCSKEILPPGEYGEKPIPLINYFGLILIALSFMGIFLNHAIHNQGKEIGIKLNLPPKLWAAVKKKWQNMEKEKEGEE